MFRFRSLLKNCFQINEKFTPFFLQPQEGQFMLIVFLRLLIEIDWMDSCSQILNDHPEDWCISVYENSIVFVLQSKASRKHGVEVWPRERLKQRFCDSKTVCHSAYIQINDVVSNGIDLLSLFLMLLPLLLVVGKLLHHLLSFFFLLLLPLVLLLLNHQRLLRQMFHLRLLFVFELSLLFLQFFPFLFYFIRFTFDKVFDLVQVLVKRLLEVLVVSITVWVLEIMVGWVIGHFNNLINF